MSALRFCVLAVVAATLASAQMPAMWSNNCGTAPTASQMYYNNASIQCTAAITCQTGYCACVGSTRTSGTTCAQRSSNCSRVTECIGALTVCLNVASDNSSCTGLNDLHLALLGAETSGQWNTSTAFAVCKYRTCELLNETASENCMVDAMKLCPSPIKFVGTMLMYGNWAGVDLSIAKANLEADLLAFFGYLVRIIRIFTQAVPARRQAGGQLLVVEFEVEGANARNSGFTAKLNNLRNSGDITQQLSSFGAQYKAANNGASPIFIGVSAGVGSSAFSGTGIAGGVAAGPTLPTPGGSTPGPSAGPSGSPSNPGSASSSNPPPSGSSGAATQSLLAAAAVAVLSAMLF